jgi:UDP-N-acetylmuramoyl-tripeptide--D-alanyl-D-alanine ligase
MRAALEHLVDRAQRRRTVAVLGEMAELGLEAPHFHEEVGRFARELGVDVVVGVGELGRSYEPDVWAADAAAAVAVVRGVVEPGDAVLVKASRAVALEVVADALTGVIAC